MVFVVVRPNFNYLWRFLCLCIFDWATLIVECQLALEIILSLLLWLSLCLVVESDGGMCGQAFLFRICWDFRPIIFRSFIIDVFLDEPGEL